MGSEVINTCKKMQNKKFYGVLFFIAIIGIIALTLQSPEGTTFLSNRLKEILDQLGWSALSRNIRSDIHVFEYLILGIVLYCFGKEMNWSMLKILIIGVSIGTGDEILKIPLPTREFDRVDLCKDIIGVSLPVFTSYLFAKIKQFKRNKGQDI